ncbi:MAG: hypothetical protein JWL70_555, partial [Acidimicrobiia bacterium]|nr:hypothetical protein [Acidimicrobiia bacterium]
SGPNPGPLIDMQHGRCFYCNGRISGQAEVDHFLPWSHHPDNNLDNLVAAHGSCNNSKSASLASVDHLSRWAERFKPESPVGAKLTQIALLTPWPRRPARTLSTARGSYLFLPPTVRLWTSRHDAPEQVNPLKIAAIFDGVTGR